MPAFLANPLIVFAFTLFTSATLLFMVQPMIGKMILPKFGGTPQVWNSAMMFFQIALLAGYTYAHVVGSMRARKQIYIHFVVVSLPVIAFAIFPLGIAYKMIDPPPDGNPAFWVVLILIMLIGVPFLVVSTSAPLLQKWFSQSGHPAARDPYFLYAASNLGSMASLLLYPPVVEPYLTLPYQGIFWMVGYACLLGLTVYCGSMILRVAPPDPVEPKEEEKKEPVVSEQIMEKRPSSEAIIDKAADGASEPAPSPEEAAQSNGTAATESEAKVETAVSETPAPMTLKGAKRWRKREKAKAETSDAISRTPTAPVGPLSKKAKVEPAFPELAGAPSLLTQLYWIVLAFVPSSLMLGVTMYLTTDIAAIPLLWLIPLTLYLLSFILVFSRLPPIVHTIMVLALPVSVLLLSFLIISDISPHIGGISPIVLKFVINLANLFIVAMVCHGELARNRPAPQYLTKFFLLMSFGGMLGGLFNGLLTTYLFHSVVEYHLVLALACMMLPPLEIDAKSTINRWVDNGLAVGICAAGLYVGFRWYRIYNDLIAAGDPPKLVQFLALPGVKPGLVGDFLLACLVMLLFVYIFHRKYNMLPRLMDVVLPLGLFLLTSELIRRSPFDEWDFSRITKFLSFLVTVDNARIAQIFTFGLPVALCYGFAEKPIRFGLGVGAILLAGAFHTYQELTIQGSWYTRIMAQDRSFFGVLKVEERGLRSGGFQTHRLLHGTTLHGEQIVGSNDPLSYYHRTGPVGIAYQAMFSGAHAKDPVAFIGLGTGTMASYCNPGQTVTFYEIDQAVVNLAENPKYFTYLTNCKERGGKYEFRMGDARLRLRDAPDHSYRMIVVDAFTSDAIPIHLITLEAIELYFEKLTEDGIACIHISNRHLRLGPVLANIAKKLDLASTHLYDSDRDLSEERILGKNASDWVVLARKRQYLKPLLLFDRLTSIDQSNPNKDKSIQVLNNRARATYELCTLAAMLQQPGYVPILIGNGRWEPVDTKADVGVWTDDYSNILSIFRWE